MTIIKQILLFLAFFLSESTISDERPTRSECIIGYALEWTRVDTDSYKVREAMFDWLPRHRYTGELASMSLKPDNSRIYLQYLNRCEEKHQMATDLINFWRSKGLDLPEFDRLPEPIVPSPDTIDRKGPYWRDPNTPLLKPQYKPPENI